jgi:uncharacterized membrane protein
MIPRLLAIWVRIRSGLWATPLAMVCIAAAAATIASGVRLRQGGDPVWFLYSGDAANAAQFLSHLVGAMITMTTLALSITMVVLTLAAQQLGPRLIQTFMRDWHTQVTLGLFIATVVYLLLVLRSTYGLEDRTPNLAVTIGSALVLTSVVMTLVFVHHLAHSIIADNVVQRVGAQLDREIARLLPDKDKTPPAGQIGTIRGDGAPLLAASGGYVQVIDFDSIVRAACEADVVVELDVRAGHHIIARNRIGWIAPSERATDDLRAEIAGSVICGSERTPVQDLEFSIRYLAEIAIRALSPGINDPYTAMAVIDRLALSVHQVMQRGPAQSTWRDGKEVIRVIAPVSTFEGIVDAAFHQIRQRAVDSPDVLIRMAESLTRLMQQAEPDQRAVLAEHLRLVVDAGRRNIEERTDLEALENRAKPALSKSG